MQSGLIHQRIHRIKSSSTNKEQRKGRFNPLHLSQLNPTREQGFRLTKITIKQAAQDTTALIRSFAMTAKMITKIATSRLPAKTKIRTTKTRSSAYSVKKRMSIHRRAATKLLRMSKDLVSSRVHLTADQVTLPRNQINASFDRTVNWLAINRSLLLQVMMTMC